MARSATGSGEGGCALLWPWDEYVGVCACTEAATSQLAFPRSRSSKGAIRLHGRELSGRDPGLATPVLFGSPRALERTSRRVAGRAPARPSPSDVENLWAGSDTSVNGRFEERRNDRKDIEMRKLIATEWMSLDGVVQAPSSPDEDRSGGFDRGGWHTGYFDDHSMNWVAETVGGAGGYLLGRGTYEIFAGHWPNASEEEQVLAEPLNTRPKYVASTTLVEPLEWQHSTLLRGDVGDAVRALKAQDGDDLLVIGSPGLVQSLVELDLLDEVRVMIDPLVVGAGKRLFGDGIPVRALRLVESQATGTGAIIATYATTE